MDQHLLYMAPIRGVTDFVFRDCFARRFGGFDLAVAPFISTRRDRKLRLTQLRDILPENNDSMRVVPQILGNDAEDFVYLANYLYDIGHKVVNWNLGCPFPRVARKKRGAGMLPYTSMIVEFLDSVLPRLKGGISIKTRLGYSTSDDLFRLLAAIEQYPIVEIIIHPRTGVQRYGGEVDLEAFASAVSLSSHTIVYNGDIRTPSDFARISSRFPNVRRWMIGRGALGNPFLPSTIKSGGEGFNDKVGLVHRFHDDLFFRYSEILSGPSHLLDRMKGLWRFLSPLFADFQKTAKAIARTQTVTRYREIVDRFFESEARIDPRNLAGSDR